MSEKAYILNVYNTMTGEFELVQVTKEVFQTYRRTKWHIEDSTERFYKHETQMSSLIGGENDGYERFHEFIRALLQKPLRKGIRAKAWGLSTGHSCAEKAHPEKN